jgi:hypothetical protein
MQIATEPRRSAASVVVRPRGGARCGRLLLVALACATVPSAALAYRARVRWQPVSGTTVASYRVWLRTPPSTTASVREAGLPAAATDGTMTFLLDGLDLRTEYVVSVSAKRPDGSETPRSNEVSTGYGQAAAVVDSDGDGLTDAAEDVNLNGRVDPGESDPLRADSDGDGVRDAQDDCQNTPAGAVRSARGCACGQLSCRDGNPCTVDGCSAGVCTQGSGSAGEPLSTSSLALRPASKGRSSLRLTASFPADIDASGGLTLEFLRDDEYVFYGVTLAAGDLSGSGDRIVYRRSRSSTNGLSRLVIKRRGDTATITASAMLPAELAAKVPTSGDRLLVVVRVPGVCLRDLMLACTMSTSGPRWTCRAPRK